MINVVNKKTHKPTENDFYVGRGSCLGNPYSSINYVQTKALYKCETRQESIQKFYEYIKQKISQKDIEICSELNKIWKAAKEEKDVNLVCYCYPKSCHATIIKKIIEEKL